MKTKLLTLALMFISIISSSAQMKTGDNVVVDDATGDDLYVAGGTVTINGPVKGDLIAAGGTITINDSISQDALLAGSEIYVNGIVKDDIRCAGGTIQISSNVFGDLVVTGGTVTIDSDVTINGDLLISGGEVTINGSILGEIKSVSGVFVLNGFAARNIDCRGGKIVINGEVLGESILAAEKIEIGSNAAFANGVQYWANEGSIDFHSSIKSGAAVYDPALKIESGKWHYLGFASLLMAIWYLGTALVFIILMRYLFSNTFAKAANTIQNFSAKSLGFGVLFLLGVPIVILFSAVTIIGLPISALILIGYITVILLGTVIVSLLVANWINNIYNKSWTSTMMVLVTFGIFIILKLATLTPVIGPLIMFLLVCIGFGGLIQNIRWKSKSPSLT